MSERAFRRSLWVDWCSAVKERYLERGWSIVFWSLEDVVFYFSRLNEEACIDYLRPRSNDGMSWAKLQHQANRVWTPARASLAHSVLWALYIHQYKELLSHAVFYWLSVRRWRKRGKRNVWLLSASGNQSFSMAAHKTAPAVSFKIVWYWIL